MSFKNRWTINSSYNFQVHWPRSQRRRCFSQTALLWFEELPDLSPALPGLLSVLPGLPLVLPSEPKVLSTTRRCSPTYHNHSHGTPVPVIRDRSYSEVQLEWPPRVWYSPEIDTFKFTLHIRSDTPGVFQRRKYILLMSATADISCLIQTKTKFCDGKDVWCCLSWHISGMLYESHANYHVMLYG